jgi:hypothetical protein
MEATIPHSLAAQTQRGTDLRTRPLPVVVAERVVQRVKRIRAGNTGLCPLNFCNFWLGGSFTGIP